MLPALDLPKSLREVLSSLRVDKIRALAREEGLVVSRQTTKLSKQALIDHILAAASSTQLCAVFHKAQGLETPGKRKQSESRQEESDQLTSFSKRPRIGSEESCFMQLPDRDIIQQRYAEFYHATSQKMLQTTVCAVCAQERLQQSVQEYKLEEISNGHRLQPKRAHKAHELFHGMLLDPAGISETGEPATRVANICIDCAQELKSDISTPPRNALANNLWIGSQPLPLRGLTFPEQLLLARLFPRVYVFKLYPKDGSRHSLPSLQRGIRGSLCTYELDTEGIANMLAGNLMPPPLRILSSVITVTYVGQGSLPKNWLKNTFRVRRMAVASALEWLISNNPHYSHITLDHSRLQSLPEDEVPDEILNLIRQTTDTSVLDEEDDSYVPTEADIAQRYKNVLAGNSPDDNSVPDDESMVIDELNDGAQPEVIPLLYNGAMDTDLNKLSVNEMMSWGLANLWKEGREGGYLIRHGGRPVSDFPPRPCPNDDPTLSTPVQSSDNYFERAFPILFPYGVGGIEANRPVPVSFIHHLRWCLNYHDHRFRRHETFPFVGWNIYQRRQALSSARLEMSRRDFERDLPILSTITMEKLDKARAQEERGEIVADSAVRLLRKHVRAAVSRLPGSDQRRIQLRSKIWSTSICLGPPSLWITINPDDLNDPIAQLFAGENINLDHFVNTEGPSKSQRAKNIADDPFAAAKFFRTIITAILETLLGVKISEHGHHFDTIPGIFGKVSAYFGTVETQNRGTLHLHMLIWLRDAPSPDQMTELLQSPAFRARVREFIKTNIRAYLPGLESEEAVKAVPIDKGVGYCRPPNPSSDTYEADCRELELRLARTEQVHTCRLGRCLRPDARNQLRCKRRAPFPCAEDDFITEAGKWGPKRLYGYVNAFCPAILINARCNNDIKLLTNGSETKNITFYIAMYATKKLGKIYNLSAIMANGYAYHQRYPNPQYAGDLRENQRLLLFRLMHAINREQEMSAPMVISLIMGWDDVYTSHTYSPIYWTTFAWALMTQFPELRRMASNNHQNLSNSDITNLAASTSHPSTQETERLTLAVASTGQLATKSQFTDYTLRGSGLEDNNILDFFVNTYDERIKSNHNVARHSPGHPGRPRHERFPYLDGHPFKDKQQRVRRQQNHRNLPNFIGRYFPQQHDPLTQEFYYASMLMLLKPWRCLATDLLLPGKTWEESFNLYVASTTSKKQQSIAFILSGIQYFYDCEKAAQDETPENADLADLRSNGHNEPYEEVNEYDLDEDVLVGDVTITEADIDWLRANQVSPSQRQYASVAIWCAQLAQVFSGSYDAWSVSPFKKRASAATGNDIARIIRWREQLSQDVNQLNATGIPGIDLASEKPSVELAERLELSESMPNIVYHNLDDLDNAHTETSLLAADVEQLQSDQRRAYDIIEWHLSQTLLGNDAPPLRMIIHGEGGTGKSKVIQTVTELFRQRGVSHMLVKAAYTGIAASLIDGKTTHVARHISRSRVTQQPNDAAKDLLVAFWKGRRYLIIDEYSMITKSHFAILARNISIGIQGEMGQHRDRSFGGLNVIICGDLHQFPPVAASRNEILYRPSLHTEPQFAQIGRSYYEEFTTVVLLKQQMRVTDPVWHAFLQRLRYGRVEQQDIVMLRSLIIGQGSNIDFSSTPWNDVRVVTPRHSVRERWNDMATKKWCSESGNQLYVCTAEDTVYGRAPGLWERYKILKRSPAQRKNDLPEQVQLAIGMKVMVTTNLQTDLDLANGARGEIVDIILDPDEEVDQSAPIVKLKKLPVCILVKLNRTRASVLEGLEEGVILVEPCTKTMQVTIPGDSGKAVTRTVRRKQFPITGAYAFTDYRAQGQTIQHVLVDIAPPLEGPLSLFNLYVALSRSSGRDSIGLLRDFDDSTFEQSHNPDLLAEDDRLEYLNEQTKQWWARMATSAI